MWSVVCGVVLLAGCLQNSKVVCEDGRTCPMGSLCDDANHGCAYQGQFDACVGTPELGECDARGRLGLCHSGVCLEKICGDGVVRDLEQCDGTNLGAATDCRNVELGFYEPGVLRCTTACTYDVTGCGARCGDGVRTPNEQCEGTDLGGTDCSMFGFYSGGLECTGACTFDIVGCADRCGDGTRNGPEECDGSELGTATCVDLGFYEADTLTCDPLCRFDAGECRGFCGDGIVDADHDEECDNTIPLDSCVERGFDVGSLACTLSTCQPDFSDCRRIGWQKVTSVQLAFWSFYAVSPTDAFAGGAQGAVYRWNGATWSAMPDTTLAGNVNGLVGFGASDVWAVSDQAQIGHWNGTAWTVTTPIPGVDYYAIDGISTTDLWAVADGHAAHWNGSTWTDHARDIAIRGVAAIAPNDVWIVGDEIHHWNGTTWTIVVGVDGLWSRLNAVWGSATNDVYAAGDEGLLLHWDGTGWTSVPLGTSALLAGVTGTGRDDVYVVGDSAYGSNGSVFHFDGRAWHSLDLEVDDDLHAIGLPGDDSVFIGGAEGIYRGRGDSWLTTKPPVPSALAAVGGTSPTEAFAVGPNGLAFHYDGVVWRATTTPTSLPLTGISGRYVVGARGLVLRWSGSGWEVLPSGTTAMLVGVHAATATDVFVWGAGTLRHYDGVVWTDVPLPTGWTTILGVVGSASDAWAVRGMTDVAHWDGTAWTTSTVGTGAWNELWATGSSSVWVAGGTRTAFWNGTAWSELAAHAGAATDIWATAPNDVYVARGTLNVLRWNGTAWLTLVGQPAPITKLWGSGTRWFGVGPDLALVRRDPTAWRLELSAPAGSGRGWMSATDDVYMSDAHFDGRFWSRITGSTSTAWWGSGRNDVHGVGSLGATRWNGTAWIPTSSMNLSDVSGTSPTDVWAVGPGGTILHWTGSAWQATSSPTTQELTSVHAISATDAIAVGDRVILRWNGSVWSIVATPTALMKTVWAASSSDIFAAGADGTMLHWDGATWVAQNALTLWTIGSVWGTSGTDVFASATASPLAMVVHWDGMRWTPMTDAPTFQFTSIFGTTELVLVGSGLQRSEAW